MLLKHVFPAVLVCMSAICVSARVSADDGRAPMRHGTVSIQKKNDDNRGAQDPGHPLNASSQGFGTVQAILNFCKRVDPKDAKRFDDIAKNVTGGASQTAVTDVERSKEYEQAYGVTTDELKSVSQTQAAADCARAANGG